MPDGRLDDELGEIKRRMETGHCDTDKERLFELVTELREREQEVIAEIEEFQEMLSLNTEGGRGCIELFLVEILKFIRNPKEAADER